MVAVLLPNPPLVFLEAPVAQKFKCWPADVAVLGSSPLEAGIFSVVNWVLMHTVFHYHPLIVDPNMTEVLLDRM